MDIKVHVNPGETLYYSARSATQSTATGTWDMALLFYDKNLLPVTGTEWNDRLQFSVPSASEQSKSGSTIVPAGAAYAAFRTRRGSVVNAGTATGWCEMGQIRVSRTQDGATVGADWSSNVSNIPYDTTHNNDDSVALGFNPTFSDWPDWRRKADRVGCVEYRPDERNDDQASRGVFCQIHAKRHCGLAACRAPLRGMRRRFLREHLCPERSISTLAAPVRVSRDSH